MLEPRATACIPPLLLLVTACVSLDRPAAEKRRYLLAASRSTRASPAADGVLAVPAFHVLSAWAGPGFTRRRPDGTVTVDFDSEFFVPPGTALAEIARTWLGDAGLCAAVTGEASRLSPTFWLEGDVLELCIDETDPGAARAVLAVHLVLLDRDRRVRHQVELRQTRPLADAKPATALLAWNEELAACLAQLEDELRAHLSG